MYGGIYNIERNRKLINKFSKYKEKGKLLSKTKAIKMLNNFVMVMSDLY